MYKLPKLSWGATEHSSVIRLADMACIPFDPNNTDAAEFAKWLQGGNVPDAAEENGTVSPEWVVETIARLLPNG